MNLRNDLHVVRLKLFSTAAVTVVLFATAAACSAQDAASTQSTFIVLFDRTNLRGNQTRFESAQANIGINSRSVSIGHGAWQLCDRTSFTGRCFTFIRNEPNLGSFRINRM